MIGTTYTIGQKVWYVSLEEKEYKCPICHGEGITEANVAKKIYTVKCPECCGWRYLWEKVFTVKAVKIKELEVKVLSKTSWLATYRLSNDTYLYETELNIYTDNKQSQVFASRKKALAYAKKENKKAKADQEEMQKNDAKQDLAEQEAMYDTKL